MLPAGIARRLVALLSGVSSWGVSALAAASWVAVGPRNACAGPCAPTLHPLIAEVFYDAVGDDSGREFVELFNPHLVPLPLAGAGLEAGDGSGPGRWTHRWTGAPADTVPARGRFVVGGALVVPAPDATATLDLQNGPDAVRLVWPDGEIEVVGYGAHEFTEYFCSAPAPDVASGQALARVPDDADGGGNALDFRAAPPSPGRANQPRLDLALIAGSLAIDPEQPAPGAAARLTAAIENRGAEPVAANEARLSVLAPDTVAVVRPAPALAPGDSAAVTLDLVGLSAGKRTLRVELSLPGDEAPENDADSIQVRIGPGPLEITEIQFHPAAGEGEWVEVRNRSGGPIAPQDVRLSDRHGSPGTPVAGGTLPPESLAVLVQTRTGLLARFPGLDSLRVWQVAPWASLNNSDDAQGLADAVVLREGDGTLVERVEYSAAGVPAGVPLERGGGGVWAPSPDPAGTPMAFPRAAPAVAGRFEIVPRRLQRAAVASLRWELPWARARVACEVYDLAGRRRGTLLPETVVPGHAERRGVELELDPGLYVVVLRARAEQGEEALTAARPIRVGGGR